MKCQPIDRTSVESEFDLGQQKRTTNYPYFRNPKTHKYELFYPDADGWLRQSSIPLAEMRETRGHPHLFSTDNYLLLDCQARRQHVGARLVLITGHRTPSTRAKMIMQQ